MINLADVLKDSNYKLSQFTTAEIEQFEQTITLKATKSGEVPYIVCLVRQKAIKLTPEEAIRQLYLQVLIDRLHYPLSRIQVEYGVNFGREVKRADIVVMDKDRPTTVYMLVELKKPKLKDGKDQLRSYCNATGAPIAIWTNGDQISYYQRKDPNYFEDIPDLPSVSQTLADILQIKFTLEDLIANDKLVKENKSLKTLIEEMEDEVLANAGVDVFEELFKLIFTKLYDEWYSGQGSRRKTRSLEFRNTGQTEAALKTKIQDLFDKAKKKWEGVFGEGAKISLTPSHLSVCVSSLENVKLFNSNLDVIDEAFEYLINQSSKGDKGQYFTPRYVIDMCVKMLNPKEDEYMIDTAAGSSGFPVHTMFHVWQQIMRDQGLEASHLFTAEPKPPECEEYVREKVFSIDFDEKAVRVARTLNLIAGDGEQNVLHLNTLDFELWDEVIQQEDWNETYNAAFNRLKKLRSDKSSYQRFQFDVLMANPPFAGDIKEPRMIARYDLAKKPDGKWQTKVGRDILFIERNLDFLKPGGRMAIVLPQGRFNNSSDKNIRDFIAERCRILAVVGLHGNTFKPHTGTKTSVLFVQKWNDDPKVGALCPRRDDYSIFFATMQKTGKDNSGEKVYRRIVPKDEEGLPEKEKERKFLLDPHDHLIVDHDLYNHEGLTEEGIAEAFIEFAKKENLSFFKPSPSMTPFDAVRYQQLMDGLEATEVTLNDLRTDSNVLRIDAEFYQKHYLRITELLNTKGATDIRTTNAKLDCSAFYPAITQHYRYQSSDDIPFLRVDEIQAGLIQITDSTVFLPEAVLAVNQSTICRASEGDIVIAKGGNTLAKIGLISGAFPSYAVCRDVIVLKTDELAGSSNKYFLWAFLHSQYGYDLMLRTSSQTGQPHLTLDAIYGIPVPVASIQFQEKFETIYHLNKKLKDDSAFLYQQAEDLLLSELGLQDWQPTEETVAVKSLSESFLSSGRLDAEYYQPKYDELETAIAEYGFVKLITISSHISTGFTYDSSEFFEEGIDLIRINNITPYGLDLSNAVKIKKENSSLRLKDKVELGEILISMSGTIGLCCHIRDQINAFINQRIMKLKPVNFSGEVLALIINSDVGKMQLQRVGTGGVQTNLANSDILNIKIPMLSSSIQQKISKNIHQSLDLKHKSKQLLEIAKTGVELAIETDEEGAIAWMNQQLEALGVKLT